MEIKPIALFHTRKKNPYEAARQASADLSSEIGEIHFYSGQMFEQALSDIEGFSHLWLIYQFHQNENWKPMVLPPRGLDRKVGVFATRSPYRPNSLGLSCVQLIERKDLVLFVKNFDLLDQTPIYDVKPYVAYADSVPEARMGWLEGVETSRWEMTFTETVQADIDFLNREGLTEISNFIFQQLSFEPMNSRKKRIEMISSEEGVLAYRTWRVHFQIDSPQKLIITGVFSAYSPEDFKHSDLYKDQALHQKFLIWKNKIEKKSN